MSATTAGMSMGAARFVGVAVSDYNHPTFHPLTHTVPGVQEVQQILSTYGYQGDVLLNPKEIQALTELQTLLVPDCLPTGGALIVLWSGHGQPAMGDDLHLIGTDTQPGAAAVLKAGFVADLATRTGASQVLLLFDTCYAGAGVLSATAIARRVLHELPPNAERIWMGVVASALELQRARDGAFLERLTALLTHGPTQPELQLRWSAHNRGVRGDDVIDALLKEWALPTQQLHTLMSGNAWVMLPNPRYDPQAPERVVEHLLLAARGGDPGEEASYFSGRVAPLALLAEWVQTARPGISVVTGPAGSGKSALVGRLVSLSNPTERARLLAHGPVAHADPGERSVHAHVHVRGSTVERLVQELDDQLVRAEVLAPRPGGPRNRGELLGALERSPTVPVLVIDGLDESGSEAWQMVSQVLHLIAGKACIIVASRDLVPAGGGHHLLAALAPQRRIDLGEAVHHQDASEAVRVYVAKRLADLGAAVMDAAAVAEAIIRLAREADEGLFLLARVVTSQLRAEPVDTRQPGWEATLSYSVDAAFERDLARILPLRRGDTDLPGAAREFLTALAWSYGAGFPAEIWPVIASALSETEVPYHHDDVYWLLSQAGRYIVEDGEGGRAVYRLSHQRLVEYLHPRPAPAELDAAQQRAVPVATALVDYYRTLLASGQEPETSTYLWRYVWRHCADAGPIGIDALRELAATNAAFVPDLAMALNNLGIRYSEVGRRQEALAPTAEAVQLRRELAATNAAFVPNLASALTNLGIRYSEVGRRQEALAPTAEAVQLYRELAATNAAFVPNLAGALNNLGTCYSKVGRRQEALAPTEEAVQLCRELAATNAAFVPNLARALTNLGNHYSEVGRRQEALAPTAEAVQLCRELAATNAAFVPDLAGALTNLGIRYSEVGRRQEALAPTAEAVQLYREPAATNAAFVPDLARALNNLGDRYSEVGRPQEAGRVWEETLQQFTSQPAGYASLATSRALARPAEEIREACADLQRSLRLDALPTGSMVEVRRACRTLRERHAAAFDAAWRNMTGELPAWLLIAPALYQEVLAWLHTPTWQASYDYVQAHAATLLSEDVQPIFDELELAAPDDAPILQQHRALLRMAQQHGIDAAYRPLLVREVVTAWMRAESWPDSQAFLAAHYADLTSDEALASLADLTTNGQPDTHLHHAVLTLARLGQAERAYAAIAEPVQLQTELDAARQDVDETCLMAYATIGLIIDSDNDAVTAQAFFHLALSQALTDGQDVNPELSGRARSLAPDQVPVWLGHIRALLSLRPDRAPALLALSQTLLTQPLGS